MPRTTKKDIRGEPTLAVLKAQGIRPEDIDETWLDEMVKRLFTELKRQLSQVEGSRSATKANTAAERAANARTLASLERTLERLAKLEQLRLEKREKKVAVKEDEARYALERKIDRLADAVRAQENSDGADG